MKHLDPKTTVLNIIGIILSLIIGINNLDPIWYYILAAFLIILEITPYIKWKKTEKEKEPD